MLSREGGRNRCPCLRVIKRGRLRRLAVTWLLLMAWLALAWLGVSRQRRGAKPPASAVRATRGMREMREVIISEMVEISLSASARQDRNTRPVWLVHLPISR